LAGKDSTVRKGKKWEENASVLKVIPYGKGDPQESL
jgi:hypothetical protein